MAKKPPIASRPRVKIPVERQTPKTDFGDRQKQPVTRLPPTNPHKENPQ